MSVVAEFKGGPLDGGTRVLPRAEPTYEVVRRDLNRQQTRVVEVARGIYDRRPQLGDGGVTVYDWRGWQ